MNAGIAFDDLTKAAAGGMTRRAGLVRALSTVGSLLLGAVGLRASRGTAADPPAKPPNLVETLKDGTFKCSAPKGAMLVEGGYDVCLYMVSCFSTQGAPARGFMPMCKAKGGKCDRWEVCGNPDLQKHDRVVGKDARLAEVGPDDRRMTDKYGRKCRYTTEAPKAMYFMKEKEVISFCATPIVCTGGDGDAPDHSFAACEPTETNKEEGKQLLALTCPRVNLCINQPIKSSKGDVIAADT